MSNNEKIFIKNLIILRKSNRLYQKELAGIIGATLTSYKSWESFRVSVPLLFMVRVAVYFQYPLDTLVKEALPMLMVA